MAQRQNHIALLYRSQGPGDDWKSLFSTLEKVLELPITMDVHILLEGLPKSRNLWDWQSFLMGREILAGICQGPAFDRVTGLAGFSLHAFDHSPGRGRDWWGPLRDFLSPLVVEKERGEKEPLLVNFSVYQNLPESQEDWSLPWVKFRGGMENWGPLVALLQRGRPGGVSWTDAGESVAEPAATEIQLNPSQVDDLRRQLLESNIMIRRLMRSERRYKKFFEDDITGDFIINLNWRVLDCNRSFARIFGFPSVDFALGFDARRLFPDPRSLRKTLLDFSRLNYLDYYEMNLIRPDGQAVNIIGNLVGIKDDDGKLIQIRGYLFDNTPRKNLEKQLRESQRMEGLGRLAGGVAHDFNNLLTVINGYAEMLIQDLENDEILRKDLEEIHQAGLRAADLTQQLLAFSRQQIMSPTELSLNQVLGSMEGVLRRLMSEDLALDIQLAQPLPEIKADRSQLEQVILNLVANARDALKSGGRVGVSTGFVGIDTALYSGKDFILPGDYVFLRVEDNGEGMDLETQKRIFEPFFTTKDRGKGSGLGLATVYGIVQQSGAHLHLQSSRETGTIFTVYFLAGKQGLAQTVPRIYTPLVLGKTHRGRLVLVEDEEKVRDYSARVLRRYGYEVTAFGNGALALDYLVENQDQWDMVITDVVMPVMGGVELSRRLRQELSGVKLLFVSGYNDEEILRQGVSSQKEDFLSKPYSAQNLVARVWEILQRTQ